MASIFELSDVDTSSLRDLLQADEQDSARQRARERPGRPAALLASTIWARLQLDPAKALTYADVVAILRLVPDRVTLCCQAEGDPYEGDARHRGTISDVLQLPGVYGVARVTRKLRGEHALWCVFGASGEYRALRASNPRALLAGGPDLLTAPTRGKAHPLGALGASCFLTCGELGSKRFNFIDIVETLL